MPRLIGYQGCLYRELWENQKPAIEQFGQRRVETATAHLLTYDGQFSVNPKPLGDVKLRSEVRTLYWQLLGFPPEHPLHGKTNLGPRLPNSWDKPAEAPPEEKPKRRTRKK
jgi:hypothetical protein